VHEDGQLLLPVSWLFSSKCKLALLSKHGEAMLVTTTCRRLLEHGYRQHRVCDAAIERQARL
jgi:hypothetical protein